MTDEVFTLNHLNTYIFIKTLLISLNKTKQKDLLELSCEFLGGSWISLLKPLIQLIFGQYSAWDNREHYMCT